MRAELLLQGPHLRLVSRLLIRFVLLVVTGSRLLEPLVLRAQLLKLPLLSCLSGTVATCLPTSSTRPGLAPPASWVAFAAVLFPVTAGIAFVP